VARDDVGEQQLSRVAQLVAGDGEEVRKFGSREVLNHGIDDDHVDRPGRHLLELLRGDDGDIRPPGVAGSQPFPDSGRAVAQEQMGTRVSNPMRRERVPAPVVHDPRTACWQVVGNVTCQRFVMHALVAGIDVNCGFPVPVLGPAHGAANTCYASSPPGPGRARIERQKAVSLAFLP
jgi:hypothetical protein